MDKRRDDLWHCCGAKVEILHKLLLVKSTFGSHLGSLLWTSGESKPIRHLKSTLSAADSLAPLYHPWIWYNYWFPWVRVAPVSLHFPPFIPFLFIIDGKTCLQQYCDHCTHLRFLLNISILLKVCTPFLSASPCAPHALLLLSISVSQAFNLHQLNNSITLWTIFINYYTILFSSSSSSSLSSSSSSNLRLMNLFAFGIKTTIKTSLFSPLVLLYFALSPVIFWSLQT